MVVFPWGTVMEVLVVVERWRLMRNGFGLYVVIDVSTGNLSCRWPMALALGGMSVG